MLTTAREVLEDCRWALTQQSPSLAGEALRVNWVAVLTLLRAVGHVLDKVDAERSSAVRKAVDSWWEELNRSKPEPAIFWGFIEEGRNLLVKEYSLGFHRTIRGNEGPGRLNLRVHLESARHMKGGSSRIEPAADAQIVGELLAGPFKGRDEREVAGEAIAWWESEFAKIEELASRDTDTAD